MRNAGLYLDALLDILQPAWDAAGKH